IFVALRPRSPAVRRRPRSLEPPLLRHPIRCALAALVLIAGLPSAPLAAQSTLSASVSGTVTDALGGPLPRVLVSLNPIGAGTYRETTTDNQGAFAFALVVPGVY